MKIPAEARGLCGPHGHGPAAGQDAHPKRQLTRLLAGLAGAATLLLLGPRLCSSAPEASRPQDPVSQPLHPPSAPARAALAPRSEVPAPATSPVLPAAPFDAGLTRHTDRVKAMHSDDMYAAVVQQWNDYRKGGYPTVVALRVACQQAILLSRSSGNGEMPDTPNILEAKPLPIPGESAASAMQRETAWQRINQRCLPIAQDNLRMNAPETDEPFEQDRERVRATGDYRQMVALEFKYGRLDQVLVSYYTREGQSQGFIPWFEGKPLGGAGRAELYDQALSLAGTLLYADPHNPSPHLYELALCAQKGLCTGSLEERMLADYPVGSAERATLQGLYPRMMAAVLRGDLNAFEFRRKPS